MAQSLSGRMSYTGTVSAAGTANVQNLTVDGQNIPAGTPSVAVDGDKAINGQTQLVLRVSATDDQARQTQGNIAQDTLLTYAHDANGNMTTNQAWAYSWNSENRLIAARERADKAGIPLRCPRATGHEKTLYLE